MAKKGMKRPEWTHIEAKNDVSPVPALQGKQKTGRAKARPIVSGTSGAKEKVWHTERPIPSDVYPVIDTDLARDNLENDLTAADRQDL